MRDQSPMLLNPPVGAEVVATGLHGRAEGERHRITRILANTIWTIGLTPGSDYYQTEDFIARELFHETFEVPDL
jgi:hypothetical protein